MAGLQQERSDSDADWEMRLQEAVDSAEQWKAFAEKLGKEKGEIDAHLSRLQVQAQVGVGVWGGGLCGLSERKKGGGACSRLELQAEIQV